MIDKPTSNVMIYSNLMPDEGKYLPEKKHIPGDMFKLLYPTETDSRVQCHSMSPRQIKEMHAFLLCLLCKKPCAGTCEKRRKQESDEDI